MVEKVNCHQGKCWEEKKGGHYFEDLFEDTNIVSGIEKDLWGRNFYGEKKDYRDY